MKTLMRAIAALLAVFLLPVAAPAETAVCPGCGETVEAGYRFCPYCGYENEMPEPTPVPEDWFCTRCMQYVDASFKFCRDCGGTRETTGLQEGEWFCGNCRRVNKGGFCGKCGKSREEAAVMPPKPTPTPKPTPVPEHVQELQAIRAAKAGDYVTYGHYPQTAEGNDETPIEWLVLDVQGDKALLLSRYGLDAKPYKETRTYVTWETCTLREWLNEDFLNKAFSAEEQAAIRTTNVDNSKSQGYSGWSTDGRNDTQDKVFLLSYAEANRYLGVEHNSVSGSKNNTKSRVAPTAYAVKNGAYMSDSYKTADGASAGWWWLRSPGYEQSSAALASTDGSLINSLVNRGSIVVRPAFWIDLES